MLEKHMHQIFIQHTTEKTAIPKTALLRKWAKAALVNHTAATEVTIRIVGIEEMTYLNTTYRHKTGPTNVLSFPFSMPKEAGIDLSILGDIVICADVVNQEAILQNKPAEAHWAHMVVHGVLHLLGYDHVKEEEAKIMEALEVEVLTKLGFPDPYRSGENVKDHE